jgi:hypothetical protein
LRYNAAPVCTRDRKDISWSIQVVIKKNTARSCDRDRCEPPYLSRQPFSSDL